MPFATFDFHQKRNKKRLNNNANTKISHSQEAEQKFCRRMNRRNFVKSNEDQSVAECCGDCKKNVQGTNQYIGRCLINHPLKIDLKLRNVHHTFEVQRARDDPEVKKCDSVQNCWSDFTFVKLVGAKDLADLDRRSCGGGSVAVVSLFGVICAVSRRTIEPSEDRCYKWLFDAINREYKEVTTAAVT